MSEAILRRCRKVAAFFLAWVFVAAAAIGAEKATGGQVKVSVIDLYTPNNPEESKTQRLIELMKEYPELRVVQWGGLSIPGGGRAQLMMAIAGKTAPDIGLSWFHIVRSEIKQGFIYPLNEWIGDDKNGNGRLDDAEAIWPEWKKIKPLWREVVTYNGKIYAVPLPITSTQAIIYRIDMAAAAGLDPNNPPRTWDELIYWCQKLTNPKKEIPGALTNEGQKGVAIATSGWQWLPWIQSQGADPMIQLRTSPKTDKTYAFGSDETRFLAPDGEDLKDVKPVWQANLASPEGLKAAELVWKLRWMKWTVDPKTGEPITLTPEDLARGYAVVSGREVKFVEADIIKGVGRLAGGRREDNPYEMLGRGDVAMTFASADDLLAIGSNSGVDPALLSWFPYPAGPGPKGQRCVQIQNHYIVMYEGVGDRPKRDRDYVWKCVTALNDVKTFDNTVREKVLSGMARFVNPKDLGRLGYEEYVRDIPLTLQRNYRDLEEGKIAVFTEPWMGFWFTMDVALNREVLGRITAANGEDFDYVSALKYVQEKANSGVMFETPPEVLDKARPYARIIVAALTLFIIWFAYLIVRDQLKKNKAKKGARNVYNSWLAWGLVLPALLLIAVWRYYPLAQGAVMAFLDYKVTGKSEFVGLNNFIVMAMDKGFWMSLLRTVYFVFLNMTLAFTAPIALAILLTEVPRCKVFFRTLFFLPQMTSGLVITLLWKLMYEPTPQGFFNQLVAWLNYIPGVHVEPQFWLQDPNWAMICCVLPTVWASMGMASLIYLAALHSIPVDFYEAAEIDGAGICGKIRHITLPSIMPLIVINFVGTFIGTFQNMGNIFLLTFGGPGEATMVVGLRIWVEAYNNLRFSMATSMAWALGSLLIGFTYFQIQFLNKVEYRRASEN